MPPACEIGSSLQARHEEQCSVHMAGSLKRITSTEDEYVGTSNAPAVDTCAPGVTVDCPNSPEQGAAGECRSASTSGQFTERSDLPGPGQLATLSCASGAHTAVGPQVVPHSEHVELPSAANHPSESTQWHSNAVNLLKEHFAVVHAVCDAESIGDAPKLSPPLPARCSAAGSAKVQCAVQRCVLDTNCKQIGAEAKQVDRTDTADVPPAPIERVRCFTACVVLFERCIAIGTQADVAPVASLCIRYSAMSERACVH
jgi:hypothetical protein